VKLLNLRKLRKYIQVKFLPFVIYAVAKVLYFTNKKNIHIKGDMPNEAFIVSFWHSDILMIPLLIKSLKSQNQYRCLVSEHNDGETMVKAFKTLGIGAIRGSSTRGGKEASTAMKESIKNGINIMITPDGPKGPIHTVANGVISVSQKTGAKIVACSYKASKFWRLNTWDKFTIPKPFGIIDFYVSEPIDILDMEFEEAKEFLRVKMMENVDV
jgi:lysophospholipid acyltransferase (LPLAT)-like uncharacterized protein